MRMSVWECGSFAHCHFMHRIYAIRNSRQVHNGSIFLNSTFVFNTIYLFNNLSSPYYFLHKINSAHPRLECPGKANALSIRNSFHLTNFSGQRVKLFHSVPAVKFYVNLMCIVPIVICQEKNMSIFCLSQHGKNLAILCAAGISHSKIFSGAFRHSFRQLPFMLNRMNKCFLI